jgi:hypothetical protein
MLIPQFHPISVKSVLRNYPSPLGFKVRINLAITVSTLGRRMKKCIIPENGLPERKD